MNSLWAVTLATLVKDIRLEWRSKDALNSMLFFSLLVVVVFSFSFDPNAEESRQIAGGLVWVAFLFAAVVALNQTWARELRNQVLDAYRVSPAPANSLFLAKALGNFIFVAVLEMLMTPLFIMFYKLRPLGPAWQLIPIAALGTWAIGGEMSAGDQPLGWGAVDDAESTAAIRRAVDLGVTLFDTADVYGTGHAERVLGAALKPVRDQVVIETEQDVCSNSLTSSCLEMGCQQRVIRCALPALSAGDYTLVVPGGPSRTLHFAPGGVASCRLPLLDGGVP